MSFWPFALLVSVLGFVASPFFVTEFSGFRADQFPVPQTDAPVEPAGYAFAIWGLIYVWLVVGAVFGAVRRWQDEDWAPMRPWLTFSMVAGIPWLWIATWSAPLASLLIWVMLVFALLAVFRTGGTDRWLQQAPVAIYAGWLTAASSVAFGLMLGGYGVLGPVAAALVALAIALTVALVVQYSLHRAPEYGLTVIWALVAIIVANFQPLNAAIAGTAILGIVALLALRRLDTE